MTQEEMIAALEEVQAQQAAARLISEYALAVDSRDVDRFMAIWHPEAIWVIGGDTVVDGLDAIRAVAETLWSTYSETHHWFANPSFTVAGETMHGECTTNATLQEVAGTTYRAAATYVDEYAKSEGRWLIYRRATTITFWAPMAS